MDQKFRGIREGAYAALPIVLGYFPVAMAFGLLAKTIHLSLLDSCLFSLVVFAGASQFMALELVRAGVSAVNIVLATFLLNLRHLMMSASLAARLKKTGKGWLPLIAFGITDESFSVASFKQGELSTPFLLALQFTAYFAWSAGTFTGYLVGAALPAAVQSSLGVGLYAMFIALLVPETKKSRGILCLAVISGIIYALISCFKLLPSGWSLIATIIIASGSGVFVIQDDTAREEQA